MSYLVETLGLREDDHGGYHPSNIVESSKRRNIATDHGQQGAVLQDSLLGGPEECALGEMDLNRENISGYIILICQEEEEASCFPSFGSKETRNPRTLL
jgi:hypothetical protein